MVTVAKNSTGRPPCSVQLHAANIASLATYFLLLHAGKLPVLRCKGGCVQVGRELDGRQRSVCAPSLRAGTGDRRTYQLLGT